MRPRHCGCREQFRQRPAPRDCALSRILQMKIGFLGLGKLGLPCALAVDMKGHDVMGYDINPNVLQKNHVPYREAEPNGDGSIEPILKESNLKFANTVRELVEHSDIIFVPIQTPHEERYEGVTRLPDE